ncbi:MAG: MBL fold metallo-hydrolase, partial [Candidatus Thiodiazotropha sp.]
MSLRFAILGSGSQGNALVIETASVRILVDCGFPAR